MNIHKFVRGADCCIRIELQVDGPMRRDRAFPDPDAIRNLGHVATDYIVVESRGRPASIAASAHNSHVRHDLGIEQVRKTRGPNKVRMHVPIARQDERESAFGNRSTENLEELNIPV